MKSRPLDPVRSRYGSLAAMIPNFSGINVTPETALQVSAVWACIDVIAKALAASDWNVFKVLPNGDRDLLADDPLHYILNTRPNPDMTAFSARYAILACALSWGNGYAEIVRDMANRVVELWPIFPDRVYPYREGGVLWYRVTNDDGTFVTLAASDVLHVRGRGLSGYFGDNMIEKAAKAIALAIAQERFAEAYFGNGTQLGGLLECPGELDDVSFKRLKEQWESRHRGPGRAFSVAFVSAGMKWHPVDIEAEKAQLTEARSQQVEEICRWFGVPPHKIQHLVRATFNNIEHLGIEFYRDALCPWQRELQQEADYKLFSIRGPRRFTVINLAWTTQGDFKSRADGYRIMREIGVYSANDILRKEGENTIGPEGDIRYVNGAAIRIEDIGKNYLDKPSSSSAQPQEPVDPEEDPEEEDDSEPQAIALRAYRAAVDVLFARFEDKRASVVDAAERRGKPDTVNAWADRQDDYIASKTMPIACAVAAITRRQVAGDFLAFGRKVIRGELNAQDASAQLFESIERAGP